MRGEHFAPVSEWYDQWTNISICTECRSVGILYEYLTVRPCHLCGGERKRGVGRWILPTYQAKFWLGFWPYKKKITPGRWEVRSSF